MEKKRTVPQAVFDSPEALRIAKKGHAEACAELAATPRHLLDEGNPNHPKHDYMTMMYDQSLGYYSAINGWILRREWDSFTPNGNHIGGRWVLRDEKGNMVDFDAFRNDIAERFSINLIGDEGLGGSQFK